MYCNRLNFRSTWICASAPKAKMKMQTTERTHLVTRQDNSPFRMKEVACGLVVGSNSKNGSGQRRCMIRNQIMVASYFRKEEKALAAVLVRPQRLAVYHCSKPKSCTPDIFAFHPLQRSDLLPTDPSAPV